MADKKIKLTEWMVHDGCCAMRCILGTDSNDVANRVAFIEKSSVSSMKRFSFRNTKRELLISIRSLKVLVEGMTEALRKVYDGLSRNNRNTPG